MKFKLLLLVCHLTWAIAYGQPTKIYLSPKAAGGANQSLFIDSLKLFPLEANKDVSFGSYTYLIITKDYFLAQNYINKEIFIYAKDGRFIKKFRTKK
ncbi:hypothetical protein [Niabella ginsengisoli]|uniref:DUF4369 domain-containing protein n=1 Tax=Niabella ginsengisoli TaxID=522298 RepID=A0ABS9SP64_9BACT|nr:hypothetical protein [Niabella ginsengisoli]MCH5600194.1 hypothetical protein [Niabella ginsengisoli]